MLKTLSYTSGQQKYDSAPFIQRTARVSRPCMGWNRVKACGCEIKSGDRFYQCQWRSGLERAEICIDCARKAGIENA